MLNKQKIIKPFIFSVVIFTLLLNLMYLGSIKHYEKNYTEYNAQIISDFYDYKKNKNENEITENDYRVVCLSFKPNLFFSTTNHILGYWSGLMILISILVMIIVKINSKIFERKIFSKKEKYILLGAILMSFIIYYFYIGLMDINYHYFGLGCSRFLL